MRTSRWYTVPLVFLGGLIRPNYSVLDGAICALRHLLQSGHWVYRGLFLHGSHALQCEGYSGRYKSSDRVGYNSYSYGNGQKLTAREVFQYTRHGFKLLDQDGSYSVHGFDDSCGAHLCDCKHTNRLPLDMVCWEGQCPDTFSVHQGNA